MKPRGRRDGTIVYRARACGEGQRAGGASLSALSTRDPQGSFSVLNKGPATRSTGAKLVMLLPAWRKPEQMASVTEGLVRRPATVRHRSAK